MKPQITIYSAPDYRKSKILASAEQVYQYVKGQEKSGRELMTVIFLNSKNAVIHTELHSIGTLDAAAVYPREIMKIALLKDAASIIMVHNHPSGDPEPSLCDKEITEDIFNAGRLLGVRLLDHVILGNDCYYSFSNSSSLPVMF